MSIKKHNQKKKIAEDKAIKYAMVTAIIVVLLLTISWMFYPNELDFNDCTTDKPLQCGCPINKDSISGSKSIVLIDATDKIPDSRTQDIKEILFALSQPSGFINTALGICDRVSVYVFSNQKPDQRTGQRTYYFIIHTYPTRSYNDL